jgi:hypothetical protein
MADAGEILVGPIGREIFGAAQMIYLIFYMGNHIVQFTVAMNAISMRAVCQIVWGVVAVVALCVLNMPMRLKTMSWLSMICK